jgi:hypothetical protein
VAGVNLARILFIDGICSKSVSPDDELWLMNVSKSSSTAHIGELGKAGGLITYLAAIADNKLHQRVFILFGLF